MIGVKFSNGSVRFGNATYEGDGFVFYLPHSCDEWIIGDIEDAKEFANDLLKTIKQVEDEKN